MLAGAGFIQKILCAPDGTWLRRKVNEKPGALSAERSWKPASVESVIVSVTLLLPLR